MEACCILIPGSRCASNFSKNAGWPMCLSGVFHFRSPFMRFTTSAQIAANQSNAQHSTGPKTWEGKAVSALNNFRHGFTGAFTVLPWEDQNEFDMLLGALREEHKPSGLTETILVDKMAQALWLTNAPPSCNTSLSIMNCRAARTPSGSLSICATKQRTIASSTSASMSF